MIYEFKHYLKIVFNFILVPLKYRRRDDPNIRNRGNTSNTSNLIEFKMASCDPTTAPQSYNPESETTSESNLGSTPNPPHSTEDKVSEIEDIESSTSSSPEPMDQDENAQHIPDNAPFVGASAPPAEPQERRDSTKSEFEENDNEQYFELWSSDMTSPDDGSSQDQSSCSQEHVVSPSRKKTRQGWDEDIKRENITTLRFTGKAGIVNLDLERKHTALECFKLFVDDEMINMMVMETNRYARQKFTRPGYHEGFLSGWIDVDYKEVTQFIGLLIFMAFKRLPDTSSYWSTERVYLNSVVCRVMTQTRFHRILHFWHFGNDGTDNVYSKVNPIVDRLNNNFKKYKQPGNILYVGKSTVYLRNKYVFESRPVGVPKKGSKILKVMDQDVYTYKLQILSPETSSSRISQTKNNVLNLVEGFLDQGRLIIFHNLYISLDLARELLGRNSHSIGLIRKNARGSPKELESKDVEDGSLIGYQNAQGMSVMKWKILGAPYYGITTCHTLETVSVQKRIRNHTENTTTTVEEQVPRFLRDISLSEKVFDAHDKYSRNTSPINEHIKWYKRLASDLITNAATTNALVLYKKLNKEKMKMWDFRDRLFRELVNIRQLPSISSDDETEEPDLDE